MPPCLYTSFWIYREKMALEESTRNMASCAVQYYSCQVETQKSSRTMTQIPQVSIKHYSNVTKYSSVMSKLGMLSLNQSWSDGIGAQPAEQWAIDTARSPITRIWRGTVIKADDNTLLNIQNILLAIQVHLRHQRRLDIFLRGNGHT